MGQVYFCQGTLPETLASQKGQQRVDIVNAVSPGRFRKLENLPPGGSDIVRHIEPFIDEFKELAKIAGTSDEAFVDKIITKLSGTMTVAPAIDAFQLLDSELQTRERLKDLLCRKIQAEKDRRAMAKASGTMHTARAAEEETQAMSLAQRAHAVLQPAAALAQLLLQRARVPPGRGWA